MMVFWGLFACTHEVEEEPVDYGLVACELFDQPLVEVQPSLDLEQAAQSVLVPSESQAWSVSNEADEGYLSIAVEEWMGTLYLVVNDGIEAEILELESSQLPNAIEGCKGYSLQTYSIHAWGTYVLHFQGVGNVELSVMHP